MKRPWPNTAERAAVNNQQFLRRSLIFHHWKCCRSTFIGHTQCAIRETSVRAVYTLLDNIKPILEPHL